MEILNDMTMVTGHTFNSHFLVELAKNNTLLKERQKYDASQAMQQM